MSLSFFGCLCILLLLPLASNAGPSFAYILQAEKFAKTKEAFVRKINESQRDILVMDYSFDGEKAGEWRLSEIQAMKKSDSRRKIIAYLSIGEAENYRPYWKKEWNRGKRPPFLLAENPEWKGNFRVRYWNPEWQKIVLAYLDTILAQGFDGVYLDIVDGYEFFEKGRDNCLNPETGRTYRQDMKAFVQAIASHARRKSPHFLVIQQNAQALFEEEAYMRSLDGIGAEDVISDGRKLQKKREVAENLRYLKRAQAKGLLVVLVEYPTNPTLQKTVTAEAARQGMDLLLTNRDLTSIGRFLPASPVNKE